jgi:hypothetical protein
LKICMSRFWRWVSKIHHTCICKFFLNDWNGAVFWCGTFLKWNRLLTS